MGVSAGTSTLIMLVASLVGGARSDCSLAGGSAVGSSVPTVASGPCSTVGSSVASSWGEVVTWANSAICARLRVRWLACTKSGWAKTSVMTKRGMRKWACHWKIRRKICVKMRWARNVREVMGFHGYKIRRLRGRIITPFCAKTPLIFTNIGEISRRKSIKQLILHVECQRSGGRWPGYHPSHKGHGRW